MGRWVQIGAGRVRRLKARRCEFDVFREWAWSQDETPDTVPDTACPVDDPKLSVADRPATAFAREVRPYD